jgi:uncharacterized membrane protein YfcA
VPPATIGLSHELALLVIGLLAGLVGGLLGVGGGVVMIPALALILGDAFGQDSFHVYNLAAITTAIFLSIPATVRHTRAKAVVYPLLPGILPLAIVGVAAGVWVAGQLVGDQTRTLKRIFGVFLELVVIIGVFQEWRARQGEPHLCRACPMPRRRTLIGLLVGLPSGFIAGLLGVGGGIWAVPSQTLLLGVRLRNAIATSTVMIIGVGLATSIGQSYMLSRLAHSPPLHQVGWWLALWLTPGALIGGWCGADLTHRLPIRWLRRIFWAALALAGARMIWG